MFPPYSKGKLPILPLISLRMKQLLDEVGWEGNGLMIEAALCKTLAVKHSIRPILPLPATFMNRGTETLTNTTREPTRMYCPITVFPYFRYNFLGEINN
jgi:hypothetical protein